MHIAIIGAAGMVGRKLTTRLATAGELTGRYIERLTLADVVPADAPAAFKGNVEIVAGDFSGEAEIQKLVDARPDVIFHLAAIVSGEAELDFEKGYRINMDGMRHLLEAIRHAHDEDGYRPRLVFTSSIGVYGSPFPASIPDDFHLTPLTSYGTQKAICELLLADYSRRGFVQGVGIRLPTICVRPGKPNKAASGFFSGIIREPLVGVEAILPVPDTVRHWHASPRSAVGFLIHAAEIDTMKLEGRPTLTMPGISATVEEQIDALRNVAGEKATLLIRREPDEMIMRIVASWPERFEATRATALGFRADASFEDIIKAHIEDELQK
ncbi:SDR family oxidoreductase [Rhizobium sp. KVB221]|uniref:SDR family oxidoreductase n=1 Tax=Rhizobium setariae TaxID=2801340 RepID=A0A937CLT2_9HYPH|nr:D-erythronate dehydrogenase [Rhizobium setariae]MBL0372006.1 SDR family oxidoreductase [Rhizobium setariae]